MTHARVLLLAGMAFLSPLHAELFVGEGATSLSSMKIPTSARATAMGGAFGAVSGDVSVLEFNPAGLSNIVRTDFQAAYTSYIEDSSLQSLSVGFPVRMDNRKTLAIAQESTNSFIENQLAIGIQYRTFNADDTERTNTGVKIGDFDIRDQVLSAGLSYPFGPKLSLGATAKYIGSKIQNETANTFAFDGGLQFKWRKNMTVGAALLNNGSSKPYIEDKDPLPTSLRVGLGYQTHKMLVALDLSQGRDNILKEALGLEYELGSFVKLRGGVFNDTQLEFSGGLGIRFRGPQKAPLLTAPRRQIDEEEFSRNTLDQLEEPSNDNSIQSAKTLFSNTDIGLDYSVSTRNEFGVLHTFSLRILY